jgi:eukaryotic-like serine/threonine-protein kinase
MNTSGNHECQRCGAAVPATSTEKLCPACLLSGALEPSGDSTATFAMVTAGSLSIERPTEFPCEFGSYRLLGLLGSGGMGVVYEAEELATGRRVALKVLGQQLDSPEMRQRFLREGRLAARVNHPNSLYIFGSEEIEGLPVITMEIAGGGTLKDKLTERGPLPVAEAVDAVLDVISGLESALAHGVLHRDIKPSNCFVCPDGSVKVGDFGLSVSTLAKTDSFVTVHGKIMGTPAYASPEQLRGDTLDLRADIYSVGATLFTLLTDRAPFDGDNAIQVVANAVNQEPTPLTELREDVPPGIERVVTRCLAKEPDGRFANYPDLRNALLPFSSREPEPASMLVRASAGWIDYLIAFLPPYVALMFLVGSDELLVRPLVDRTLFSAKYYFALWAIGFLYFGIAEGVWGAGLGKWLKGLRVVRTNGRPPGFGRALLRVFIPILCVEGVRMPLSMAFISEAEWTGLQTAGFVVAAIVCGWIPALLALQTRRENGFATVWDRASGTRVIAKVKGTVRPSIEPVAEPGDPADGAESLGPYRVIEEMVAGQWIVGADPALRRPVWLLRRTSPESSRARQDVARPGRLRWLQKVAAGHVIWDAFEATAGTPFSSLAGDAKRVPWSTLRHWLHDLASEMWDAAADQTLPAELSLNHVWITAEGRAILLDEPWPDVGAPAERIPVGDAAGQQRFLNAIAACVESTGLPLHARGVLQNLADGKFERLSFLAGTLRGLLERPADVSRGIRAGSIFMLPLYIWIAFFVGRYHDKPLDGSLGAAVVISVLAVLGVMALMQLLTLPFRTTASHEIFRLAVLNAKGEPATRSHLLVRWAIVWLPLLFAVAFLALLTNGSEGIALILALVLLLLWGGAAVYSVIHPHRGLHDRLAGTWVVRR